MTRRRISTRDRLACFQENNGICHICGGKIHAGEGFDISHPIPLELGGADDKSNWRPAHKRCHARLTADVDLPNIARAKRREARHVGAKAPSARPVPGSRNTPFKRKLDGTTERRT